MSTLLDATGWARLANATFAHLRTGEEALFHVRAEDSTFVRWNHGRVRQPGVARLATVSLQLRWEGRQVEGSARCRGEYDVDLSTLVALMADLRPWLALLPPDKSLPEWGPPAEGHNQAIPEARPGPEAVELIQDAAGLEDLVGLWTDGPLFEALFSSRGHALSSAASRWSLEFSIHGHGTTAVQRTIAGSAFDPDRIRRGIAEARAQALLLEQATRPVPRGAHRVLFAPSAVGDLLQLLNWGGFSERAHRTRQSPLQQLSDGAASLHEKVHISEDLHRFGVPRFQDEGFVRSGRAALIEAGRPASWLVSPRSALEFGVPSTGATSSEEAQGLSLDAGTIPHDQLLATLGTGYYVAAAWYLNWSDKPRARATGLTRFASFRVEDGRIVAPIPSSRFDDSLIDAFGDRLIGFGNEAVDLPDTSTWYRRVLGGIRCPAALVEGWTFVT